MGIAPGRDWGEETTDSPDLVVVGGDASLAAALSGVWSGHRGAARPAPLVELRAVGSGGLAGTLGLPGRDLSAEGVRRALTLDVLLVRLGAATSGEQRELVAVSGLEVGARIGSLAWRHRSRNVRVAVDGRTGLEGHAASLVVMTGELLGDADVNPRSHPGDGVAEVFLVDVPRAQRRALRARLPSGTHVPHPGITRRAGSHFVVELTASAPIHADGQAAGEAAALDIEVLAGAYRLLV